MYCYETKDERFERKLKFAVAEMSFFEACHRLCQQASPDTPPEHNKFIELLSRNA